MHPLNSKLFFLLLVNRPKRAAASVVVAEHRYNQRGRSPEASFRLSIAFEQKKKSKRICSTKYSSGPQARTHRSSEKYEDRVEIIILYKRSLYIILYVRRDR